MDLTIARKELAAAASAAAKIASTTNSLPVCRNLSLITSGSNGDGRLRVGATDLETGLETEMGVHIEIGGSACVPAAAFARIVAAMPEADLRLRIKGDALLITCRESEYRLEGMSAEDLPVLSGEETVNLRVPAETFSATLASMLWLPDEKHVSAFIRAVHFVTHDGRLRLEVASNPCLIRCDLQTGEASADFDLMLPAEALRTLVGILPGAGVTIEAALGVNLATFRWPGSEYTTRILDGRFPNVDRVIPPDTGSGIPLPREEMMSAIRRLQLYWSASELQPLRLTFTRDRCEVLAWSEDVGRARERLELDYRGPDLVFDVNAERLSRILGGFTSATVEAQVSADKMRFTADGDAGRIATVVRTILTGTAVPA